MIHGWLVVDKQYGVSSARVVSDVRNLFGKQCKAGHAGTLDPLATGVLAVALGRATRTVSYVMGTSKQYFFTVQWGEKTNTDDCEGEIVACSEKRPSRNEVEALLPTFTGEIFQVPPVFSAIKIDGQRAYKRARAGEKVQICGRTVKILSLCLEDHRLDVGQSDFSVECGKGVYVRALARDLGEKLGCMGHVCALRRLRCGGFRIEEAWSMDDLRVASPDVMHSRIQPISKVLHGNLKQVKVDDISAKDLCCGKVVESLDYAEVEGGQNVWVSCRGEAVALAVLKGQNLHPARVLVDQENKREIYVD
jgi:tRNA pseudouridine55 synthase